jgi:hypothetical protein
MKRLISKKIANAKQPDWNIEEDEYDKVIKIVFDGVRNLLICASIFALALYSGQRAVEPTGHVLEVLLYLIGGTLLSALLGQWHRKTSRKKFRTTKMYLIVSALYVFALLATLPTVVLFIIKQN